MTNESLYQTILDRLNKNSGANQIISRRQFVDAFNKMQYYWVDQRIKLEEVDKLRQHELQHLVKTFTSSGSKDSLEQFYTLTLPDDYYYYKRCYADAHSLVGACSLPVYGDPVEESGVDKLFNDAFQEPSFGWQESFYTIGGGKLRFYYKDFRITKINLVYYRCPVEIDMEAIGDSHSEVLTELDKSNLQEVLDLTALLLAGDVGSVSVFQVLSNYIQQFN